MLPACVPECLCICAHTHVQVTSEGVRALSTLTALRALSLQHTRVGNVGANGLRRCVHLRSLNLATTRIDDIGALQLVQCQPQ